MKEPSLPQNRIPNDPSLSADDPSLSTNDPSLSKAADEVSLGRALIYRFLAAGYRYPEAESIDALSAQGRGIALALAAVGHAADGPLHEQLARLQGAVQEGTPDDLVPEYVALFSHAVRGPCPLYEAEYGESDERLQQPHELSDLSAFYRAFGLELSADVRDRVDFIAVECEFMAFLCLKQAYAEEHGKADLAAVAVDAQRKFLHDHLGRWGPAFARRVLDRSDHALYGPLARLTLVYLSDDCRRLQVTPGDENLKLRLPLKEADACLSCPMAEQTPAAHSDDPFAGEE